MLELNDYLDLTFVNASAQWRVLLQREDVRSGQRQEAFTPVETLLCFGLGLVGNRSKAGTINISQSSHEVIRLSQLFRRSPASLALKLANLDGRRLHGAKHEQQLWIRLTEAPLQYEGLYALILASGRSVGLSEEILPDFLGVDDDRLRAVIEGDSVTDDDLRASLQTEFETLSSGGDFGTGDTERALLGTARIGQQQFARKVLTNSNFACVFCGLGSRSVGLPSSRMLIASHIMPWSVGVGFERVDPRNGLAACPTHDAAFESHLISVGVDASIIRSDELQRAISANMFWRHNFGEAGLSRTLVLPDAAYLPGARYIEWHSSRLNGGSS